MRCVVNCTEITYNAALNKPAYQSGVYINSLGRYSAHLATDGNHETFDSQGQVPRCAITAAVTYPWWAVDLGRPTAVYRVDFTSRERGLSQICHFYQNLENVIKLYYQNNIGHYWRRRRALGSNRCNCIHRNGLHNQPNSIFYRFLIFVVSN